MGSKWFQGPSLKLTPPVSLQSGIEAFCLAFLQFSACSPELPAPVDNAWTWQDLDKVLRTHVDCRALDDV